MSQPASAQLLIEAALTAPAECSAGGFEVFVFSKPSPERTTPNEDTVGVFDCGGGTLVVAVADGLGGLPRGRAAAACALETLGRHLHPADFTPEHLRIAILDAFEDANRAILELGGAGTTLVVATVQADQLRTFHVGDSAAMLVGQRGVRKWETISHSPVGYGVAAGLIDETQALDHEDRHYLSNHLGASEMHIELGSTVMFAPKDTLLLASDGVLDNLPPDRLFDMIRTGPLARVSKQIVEEVDDCMANGGKTDDASFVLVRRRAAT